MGKGMKAGKKAKKKTPGHGGKGGMQQQMAQVAAMQQMMQESQVEIEKMEVSASAGGGAVEVVVTGNKQIKSIKIDKDVVDPEDVEMLEDLVMIAANEALRQMEEKSEEEMSKITGSMGLPPGII